MPRFLSGTSRFVSLVSVVVDIVARGEGLPPAICGCVLLGRTCAAECECQDEQNDDM